MTPRDFAYWLQGYFELGGPSAHSNWSLHHTQETILRHIELVKATEGAYNSKLQHFVGWVEGAIESKASSSVVEAKLHDLFEHVIDPMTTQAQPPLNQLHHGEDVGIRC